MDSQNLFSAPATVRLSYHRERKSVPRRRKPLKPGESVHVTLRIDAVLAKALDDELARMAADKPGIAFSRADVMRDLMHDGLRLRSERRVK